LVSVIALADDRGPLARLVERELPPAAAAAADVATAVASS
jgi:hypothetical protein